MRRRAAADGGVPPRHLMDLSVWIAEGRSPNPGPEPDWWDADYGGSWAVNRARIDWARARRQWFREHDDGTLETVNALFREGFNDLSPDPRQQDSEKRIMLALINPRLYQALREAVDAERE